MKGGKGGGTVGKVIVSWEKAKDSTLGAGCYYVWGMALKRKGSITHSRSI